MVQAERYSLPSHGSVDDHRELLKAERERKLFDGKLTFVVDSLLLTINEICNEGPVDDWSVQRREDYA